MNWRILDPRGWAMLIGAIAFVLLAIFLLGKCSGDRNLKKEADIAAATGKALDRVARETPAIRQDQQEKQDAVDQIPGADERLPDGFASRLERLRRGQPDDS